MVIDSRETTYLYSIILKSPNPEKFVESKRQSCMRTLYSFIGGYLAVFARLAVFRYASETDR